jgi:AcrR family transcriptional regulator
MENARRSARSRQALLQAALAVIARDGPARLTLDAIARESGISKGGLMHQFRSKDAVLKALLDHQLAEFAAFAEAFRAALAPEEKQPQLVTQIATHREAMSRPDPIGAALLAGVTAQPELMAEVRERDLATVGEIRQEAADPDLALLRWQAARGLLLSSLLGLCPLGEAERRRLFERLLDGRQWTGLERPPAPPDGTASARPARRSPRKTGA